MVNYFSRASWGAHAPEGSTSLVLSQVENMAWHYPGMTSPINASGNDGFRRVCSALRGWQTYHMVTRGWSDIAYQIAVDQVGRAYVLRGINIRSAGNGDADVNKRFGACLLVLGNNEKPSAAMMTTARAVHQDFRSRFSRIPKRPTWHGAVRPGGTAEDPSTTCPGRLTIAEIKLGHFDAGTITPTPPKDDDMPLTQADKDFITGECQRYAVANNNYTRQVLSTATKAILNEINEVDEETAVAVEARLQDEFKKINDEVMELVEQGKATP